MLRTPAFLGVSMVRRNNRRLLVGITYVVLSSLLASVILLLPRGRLNDALYVSLILVYNVVSRAVFGALIKETVLPGVRGGELLKLGLGRVRRSQDEPDERDLAVRNAAYFEAYRALALYAIALCLAAPFLFGLSGPAGVRTLMLLAMPLLVMALTLPQAVVLWTEPDVPQEAGL